MSKHNDGGPIHPHYKLVHPKDGPPHYVTEGGMTLRAYIATAAMQGILASEPHPQGWNIMGLAEAAVNTADALLEVLSDDD